MLTGNTDLNISGITSDGTTFNTTGVVPTVIAPGATATFQVRLDASIGGSFNENITIAKITINIPAKCPYFGGTSLLLAK